MQLKNIILQSTNQLDLLRRLYNGKLEGYTLISLGKGVYIEIDDLIHIVEDIPFYVTLLDIYNFIIELYM